MSDTIQSDVPTLSYYMGKNVDEMTRDELIVAVKEIGRSYNDERTRHEATVEFHQISRILMGRVQ